MKTFRIYIVFSIFVSSLVMNAQEKLPNIVLIYADDLGYGDLSCYGATKLKTPNIDNLAAKGRIFTDAHAASSVCTPSRYALMTGEYPHRKNLYAPIFLKSGLIIDTNKQTMASLLKESGYATACIGKWHLGFGEKTPNWNGELKPGPLELGFDYYFGVPVVNSHPPFVYVENHHVVGLLPEDPLEYGKTANTKKIPEKMQYNAIGGGDAAHALYDDNFVGTKLTGKAVDWINEQEENNPFFLYLATTNIHHPFTPHPRFKGTSESGLYGDFVHELDWIVGEIMQTLKDKGVLNNTLVIFTSDNGGMLNATAQESWNLGHEQNGALLGFKFDAWEGGHRVPFIAFWEGKIKAGSSSNELIAQIDMLGTFSKITNTKITEGSAPDSMDFLEALTDESSKNTRSELLISPFRKNHLSIRKGKWMYISGKSGGGFGNKDIGAHGFGGPAAISFSKRENSNIENGNLKENLPLGQLYNLEEDLGQTTNVYNLYPEVVQDMEALLEKTANSKNHGK